MAHRKTVPKDKQSPTTSEAQPHYRSGAVARMLRMPVATLRVWERRYALTKPVLSPSGQRLYAAADVQRLALLKQLADLGHAIGSVAALDMAQLQAVAATHAQALSGTRAQPWPIDQRPDPAVPYRGMRRVAVIGAALAARLQRPALQRRLGRPAQYIGPFDDVAHAAAAWQGAPADLLLMHAPSLHTDTLAAWRAQAPGWADVPTAVLYGYAAEAVCDALAQAGVAMLREPQGDAVLAQWLQSLLEAAGSTVQSAATVVEGAPRRWSDAALADFAGLSSTIACECPRHVAELLMQLSHFEAYSADCVSRSPADAELHAYLRQMAAAARAQFEAALEHVARHEGLVLPG
jgi:DNA-binding transcriptional MerR regulator